MLPSEGLSQTVLLCKPFYSREQAVAERYGPGLYSSYWISDKGFDASLACCWEYGRFWQFNAHERGNERGNESGFLDAPSLSQKGALHG